MPEHGCATESAGTAAIPLSPEQPGDYLCVTVAHLRGVLNELYAAACRTAFVSYAEAPNREQVIQDAITAIADEMVDEQ